MKTTIEKQKIAKQAGARFAPVTEWQYSYPAIQAANKIPVGCVNEQSHALGMKLGEPLLVAMDALYQYASCYKSRYGGKLASDMVLGEYWLESLQGLRRLLNGDGAIAMQRGITTDSKDNSAMETLFWECMDVAGFTEADLNQ